MTAHPDLVAPARPARQRVRGVDVARGVALIAMMTVHLLPELGPDQRVEPTSVLASGRASALFALLAGVGLALSTGGAEPRVRPWRGTVAAVLTRSLLIAVLGLALVGLDPPIAVILTNYGLLFAVAVPFLALPPRLLLWTAAFWALLAPLLSHVLRTAMTPGPGDQPSFSGLAHPVDLLQRLAVTGYYPVLTWTAYLLVGLAVGRMSLQRKDVALRLLTGGAGVALLSGGLSVLLLGTVGWQRLLSAGAPDDVMAALGPGQLQLRGRYGTTPTTSWWWEAVVTPHSGTAFDLAQTAGSALAVLGLALLAVRYVDGHAARLLDRAGGRPSGRLSRPPRWSPATSPAITLARGVLAALAAVGSMTLTLYSLHVVAAAAEVGPADRHQLLLVHVSVAVVVATWWRSLAPRGPLEQLVSWASRGARAVTNRL